MLARCISLVENEAPGYEKFLASLSVRNDVKVIGITGPPGAGKSTLTDALIANLISLEKKVAVICVDPSSPFNLGALLGDRVRMNRWYTDPRVYIRSLATRGSLGGLHPMIIEITQLLKSADFDYIIVETVGVGQSEIEIAGLSDTTVVVLVPESGDEIQTMKAGLMEIADVFVVNKADRPEARLFSKNLQQMMAPAFRNKSHLPEIIETVATRAKGIDQLVAAIQKHQGANIATTRKAWLLTEKAFHLLQKKKMEGFDKNKIMADIGSHISERNPFSSVFNIFEYVQNLLSQHPDGF